MASAAYRFIPWSRRGLAGAITLPDQGQPMPARATFAAGLTVSNVGPRGVDLTLYGPGDVLGLDPRVIIRAEPKPHISDAEPNYLAFIEFDAPDLPWMFSPAAPSGDRLRPWLALVVLDASGPGAVPPPATARDRPLPFVRLTTEQVATQLPDLAQSWAWAHGQLLVEKGVPVDMAQALGGDPAMSLSRLLCPRRLQPMTSYIACLVPAFDVGVLRGLGGTPAQNAVAAPAWNPAQPGAIELPVYHHWGFATGPEGDFETLARQLKPYKSPPSLGTAPMHIWDALPGLDAATPQPVKDKPVLMNGALRASEQGQATLAEIDPSFQTAIGMEVDAPAALAETSTPDAVRAIAAPIYAGLHLNQARIAAGAPSWLRELNVDPRARAAAGIAADVVRQNQEELMQACWEQVGDVLRATTVLNFAALAAEALDKLHQQLAKLPAVEFLAIAAPALVRLPHEGLTIAAKVARTSLPDASFSAPFRRLSAARNPAVKAAAHMLGVTAQVGLVEAMAPGLAAVEPNNFVPDGIATMRAFDQLAMPTDPGAAIDLSQIGLEMSVPATVVAALRDPGGGALGFDGIAIDGAVPRSGMIGELELGAAASLLDEADAAPAGPVGLHGVLHAMRRSAGASPGVAGFLLELGEGGEAAVSPLEIDTGGQLLVRARGGRGGRVVAAVGEQLRAGGRDAVARALSELPVGMVAGEASSARALAFRFDRGDGGVLKVEEAVVGRDGRRTFRTRAKQGATKTVGALNKDVDTVGRLAGAYADLGRNFGLGVAVNAPKAVAFDVAKAASSARQRLEPRANIAARLATMVTAGGQHLGAGGFAGVITATTHNDRIICAPQIIEPAYIRLAKHDREAFVPGIGAIPQNTMSLLETNSRFIEAYMVGLNHEMNRELLWRSYPTDQRGTVFRHFWDWDDGGPDIPPIHQFSPGKALGGHCRGGMQGELVLLVRGALLRRYPNSFIYAWRAVATPGGPKLKGTLVPSDPFDPALDLVMPAFHGEFDPDVSMAGFPLTRDDIDDAPGWFFVIEQQPTEPRFGFDQEAKGAAAKIPTDWQDARWIDTGAWPGRSIDVAGPLAGTSAKGIQFGRDAAHMAALSLQRPFRVAVHASYLTSV